MLLLKASVVLDMVIDFQKDIFTVDILDRMDAYHEKIERRGVTERVIDQAQRESVETIEQLCTQRASFPANSFFQNVPDRIRLAIQLRFQYFEKTLAARGNAVAEFPNDFSEVLRFGLIDLWNERQALSPRHRSN